MVFEPRCRVLITSVALVWEVFGHHVRRPSCLQHGIEVIAAALVLIYISLSSTLIVAPGQSCGACITLPPSQTGENVPTMLWVLQHGKCHPGSTDIRIGFAHEAVRISQRAIEGAVHLLPLGYPGQPVRGVRTSLADPDQTMHLPIIGTCTGDPAKVPGRQPAAWAAASHFIPVFRIAAQRFSGQPMPWRCPVRSHWPAPGRWP